MSGASPNGMEPSEAVLRAAREAITRSLKPVRPLPSDGVLVATVISGVLLLAVLLTVPFGFQGLRSLTPMRLLPYYTVILAAILALAINLIQHMVPGAKQRISTSAVLAGVPLLLVAVAAWLFPNFNTREFVVLGIPCFRIGCGCAIVSGPLAWVFVRQGFVVSRAVVALTIGALAGIVGTSVLALHCPIHNAAHIITWHFGAALIAAISAYLFSLLVDLWMESKKN